MSLKSTVQSLVKTAFGPINSLLTAVTYTSTGSQVDNYDPNELNVSSTDTSYSVNALLGSAVSRNTKKTDAFRATIYTHEQTNSNIKIAKIPVLDLTPTPKIGDTITIDSVAWKVSRVDIDTAESLWSLTIESA